MTSKMNDSRGCSVCAAGKENYEEFSMRIGPKRVTRVQYDYRTPDGELFACVGQNLEDCRRRRDAWLEKFNRQNLQIMPEILNTADRLLELLEEQRQCLERLDAILSKPMV